MSELPLRVPPTLTDQVAEAVRDGIRARRFVPCERYSVYQLADLLGVSRSPVREALLKLAEAGLVEFERNRGFRVVLPDPRDVAEIFAVRLALEPPAARRAGAAGLDVTDALDALDAALRHDDERAFWAADRLLHDRILRGTGNRRAADIVATLRATTGLLTPPTSPDGRSLRQIRDDHEPVIRAIARGDGDGAEAAMRQHLVDTGRLLVAQVAGLPPDAPAVAEVWHAVVD
ncbi:GntR family transcriptional regulator [Micromonospora fluostatini]|uniref:GntR family transcriptional regulator n=1 Tax=Micromonospora fluostatini TaxID=1629071 RepID=A0ABY2DJS6_9ACTN|nr:GntR family transcriptional regulator [Micromonospora fluostatini]